MSEVSDLSQKNAELEFSKKKYIEKNKQLTNESKNLAGIIESLKSGMGAGLGGLLGHGVCLCGEGGGVLFGESVCCLLGAGS